MFGNDAFKSMLNGYRVTKAVAWVIDVGPAWIARYKDQCTNPTDLREAKAAAMAMAKGACGHYVVSNPIAHLADLRDHAIWLMERRGRHGLCRCCNG